MRVGRTRITLQHLFEGRDCFGCASLANQEQSIGDRGSGIRAAAQRDTLAKLLSRKGALLVTFVHDILTRLLLAPGICKIKAAGTGDVKHFIDL